MPPFFKGKAFYEKHRFPSLIDVSATTCAKKMVNGTRSRKQPSLPGEDVTGDAIRLSLILLNALECEDYVRKLTVSRKKE